MSVQREDVHKPPALVRGIRALAARSPVKLQILAVYRSLRKGRVRLAIHWLMSGHLARWQKVRAFLAIDGERCLQVGGGLYNIKDRSWINGDLIGGDIYLDAGKRLPFRSESLDCVFTEQFFEHLDQRSGRTFLKEAFRVLKPGGVLRQSTPDLAGLLEVYQGTNESVDSEVAVQRHLTSHRANAKWILRNRCQFLNDFMHLWGHQFIYDRDSLWAITEEAGFQDLTWVRFGESEHTALRERERHAHIPWMKDAFTMILEAQKPA